GVRVGDPDVEEPGLVGHGTPFWGQEPQRGRCESRATVRVSDDLASLSLSFSLSLPASLPDLAACTSTSTLAAALRIRTSNFATQALNRTCVNTSGMAVTNPSAVANSARPIDLLWLAAVTPGSPIFWKVPTMLMTVPRRPTIVAILAM